MCTTGACFLSYGRWWTRIYNPELGVGYVFLINLVANALYVPLLWRELLDFRFRLNLEPLRPMLHYAYPLMLMGLAGMVNETLATGFCCQILAARRLLPRPEQPDGRGHLWGLLQAGIFMSLVIQAFRYAAEPFFFSQAPIKTRRLRLPWF